jgi:hypothetical protein
MTTAAPDPLSRAQATSAAAVVLGSPSSSPTRPGPARRPSAPRIRVQANSTAAFTTSPLIARCSGVRVRRCDSMERRPGIGADPGRGAIRLAPNHLGLDIDPEDGGTFAVPAEFRGWAKQMAGQPSGAMPQGVTASGLTGDPPADQRKTAGSTLK